MYLLQMVLIGMVCNLERGSLNVWFIKNDDG